MSEVAAAIPSIVSARRGRQRLVLASASPRRRELLTQAGFEFDVVPADINEEDYPPGLSPADLAEWLAVAKADVIAKRREADVVLAADTVVALGDELLGKPENPAHARRMLGKLSGTTHWVFTGVAVVCRASDFRRQDRVTSSVQMRILSELEIADYVATNAWAGKAGGYGIQDEDPFVTCISGDFTNIVGLPMQRTVELLAEAGIVPVRQVSAATPTIV